MKPLVLLPQDATIVMYDLANGKEVLYFEGHEDTIIGAQFSNDCKHLATASRDNNLILWDTVIGKQIFVFEHERIVICCCFSRDGKARDLSPPQVGRVRYK